MRRLLSLVSVPFLLAACGGSATSGAVDDDALFDDEGTAALSASCPSAVTKNAYEGAAYWGTLAVRNTSGRTLQGYSVEFDVAAGVHCTNDAVPSGATLSPLRGSGASAATVGNRCRFTWASAKLAPNETLTFNYSTDSGRSAAALNVTLRSATCGDAAGGSSGGSSGGSAGGSSGGSSGSSGSGGSSGACSEPTVSSSGPLARIGACGKLVYRAYANRGDDRARNVVPDFSYAGYEGGGVAIPDVPTVRTVAPGAGDDRARIQAAIDAVSAMPLGANGYRGAVLLKRGTYELADALRIRASGVVLRGEGQGRSGTVLVATARKAYTLVEVSGDASPLEEGARSRIASSFVPVGTRTFDVDSARGFAKGQRVLVERTPNARWIDALGMGPYGWTPSRYVIGHERTITAVDGNRVTVDIPIVDAIEDGFGGGNLVAVQERGRVRHVGVEDLRLDSVYASETDENHGWIAVALSGARDSFVRRITALHFGYSAVTIRDGSAFNTVEDSAFLDPKSVIDGGRRYSFNVEGGIGNLFQRTFARGGRHNFVTGSGVTGPNVWLDCLATENHADDGPHHRWATGLLFDNTRSTELRVHNRKDAGSGHGWAGAQVMFWNPRADVIVSDAPRGAMNWVVGGVGTFKEGQWAPEEPAGLRESNGTPVTPRSLYLTQLRDRLGEGAVQAIAAPAQRRGRIWTELQAWAGEGRLTLP